MYRFLFINSQVECTLIYISKGRWRQSLSFIIYRAFTFLSYTAVVSLQTLILDFSDFFQPFFFQGGLVIQCVFNNLKKKRRRIGYYFVLLGIIFDFELSPKGSWLHVKFADVYFGAGSSFSVSTLSVHGDVKLTSLWMLLLAAVSSS